MQNKEQIEVEKKVILEPNHIAMIEREGSFLGEKEFRDIYFDRADCSLTAKNIWLRLREKAFELKVGIKGAHGLCDRYAEINDPQEILKQLGLDSPPLEEIESALLRSGIKSFANFVTKRRRYQLEDLSIDIDIADFGDLIYRIAEFELVVPNADEIQKAEDKIQRTLDKLQIDMSIIVPAKLTYYLFHKQPKHYKILVDNQVIKPIETTVLNKSSC